MCRWTYPCKRYCVKFLRRYDVRRAIFTTSRASCFSRPCTRLDMKSLTGSIPQRPLISHLGLLRWPVQSCLARQCLRCHPKSPFVYLAVIPCWYSQNRLIMNLTYVLDYRFARTPDGVIWTDTAYDAAFWEPYLRVFDQVTLLSRVRDVPDKSPAWLRVNSNQVVVEPLPHYLGPVEFLKRSKQIRRTLGRMLAQPGAVILRVPSQLSIVAAVELRKLRKDYGVEVVGDATAAFAPGVVDVAGRAFLRQWFTRSQKKICRNAIASSYVAECLHRRYPSKRGAVTLICSDVRLDQQWIRSEPRI